MGAGTGAEGLSPKGAGAGALGPELATARLHLRRWTIPDRVPFRELNADPETMTYFPSVLTAEQSDALVARFERSFEDHGFGLWAVSRRDDAVLVGAVGLLAVDEVLPFAPGVEVGWRLHRRHWGQGYATEAARAALAFAFDQRGEEEIVSFTSAINERSRGVMTRLGMQHRAADDFDHPRLEPAHRLRPHVLYRLSRASWSGAGS